MGACLVSLMVVEVCTRMFPYQIGPASENGRTDVRKHARFCFSFWGRLSGVNGDGSIICDANLGLLLLLSGFDGI